MVAAGRVTAPVEPASAVDVPEPLTEPRRDWGESPAEAARYDDQYWDSYEYNRDED